MRPRNELDTGYIVFIFRGQVCVTVTKGCVCVSKDRRVFR